MEYLPFMKFTKLLHDFEPDLISVIESAYINAFETITEPMTLLKHYASSDDKSLSTRLAPYLKATNKSTKKATDELDLIRREWSWFGEKFVEDGANIDLGDDYPYDIDYESIDMDAIINYMNEYPIRVDNALSWFHRNIDSNYTSQLMDYEKPLINKWFVHFSNNADKIFYDGFKYGNDDIARLSLTDPGNTKGKHGDYLFAYEMNDVKQYANSSYRPIKFKYGDAAVVFIASGVKFYHHGDEEPQVVFDKKSPTGCFLIENNDDRWCVYGHTPNGKKQLIAVDDFYSAMYWCRDNIRQYGKFYSWNSR